MALHAEQGILGTSFEDIARRADVALATVYRHFPTLDAITAACGQRVFELLDPPMPEDAPVLFAGATTAAERIDRLVRALCAVYDRGEHVIEEGRRTRHQVRAAAANSAAMEAAQEALVREALSPGPVAEGTTRIVNALLDFGVWKALVDRGVDRAEAPAIIIGLVRSVLEPANEGGSKQACS